MITRFRNKYLTNSLNSNCLCLLELGWYIYNLGVKGSFFWYGRKTTKLDFLRFKLSLF